MPARLQGVFPREMYTTAVAQAVERAYLAEFSTVPPRDRDGKQKEDALGCCCYKLVKTTGRTTHLKKIEAVFPRQAHAFHHRNLPLLARHV